MHITNIKEYPYWSISHVSSLVVILLLTAGVATLPHLQQPGDRELTFYDRGGSKNPLISSVLNADGSIKRGAAGSFDPQGYRMVRGSGGAPRFVANGELSGNPPARVADGNFFAGVGPEGTAVFAVAVSGDDVYVGGSFTIAGEISAPYIAKWDGTTWSSLGSGMNSFVNALAIAGNGDLYAGGSFTTAGGVPVRFIARWNGSVWSPLGSGLIGGVGDIEVLGSDIYASGSFVARWDGSAWSYISPGGTGAVVKALAVSGSDLYAVGVFTAIGSVPANNIAKWNGSSWSALGSGINGNVNAIAVSGGTVYAGGYFTSAGGMPANNIAKWDGSSWSPLGEGVFGPVNALAISQNGTLYAGGDINAADGNFVNNIALWNGSSWSALAQGVSSPATSWLLALAISGDGSVYAGGFFTTAGGYPANNIAKWNGTDWSALVHFDVPSSQATNITFGNVGPYKMEVSWTNGNGSGRVVKINTVNSFTAPADGTNPGGNSRYGGSGEQFVYNGDADSSTITGLSPNTTYYFRVYEHNGYGVSTVFSTVTAANNPNSQATTSCNNAGTVLNVNDEGAGSLRDSIANACSGGTVDFDPSVFATPRTITLTSGELVIDKSLTIHGPGAHLLSISGNNASRVFQINSGVMLDGITIRDGGGAYNDWGGGIYNAGSLTISNSIISGNTAGSFCGSGGGVFNYAGILSIINSTISGNESVNWEQCGEGGGITNYFGTVTITGSTISGNEESGEAGGGGGILNYPDSTMSIFNSTISGNIGTAGGGISNAGTLTIANSTITGNKAYVGGGIASWSSSQTLTNTIVAGNINYDGTDDIFGTIETASHNLIGDAASSGGIQNGVNGNIVGLDPKLGPLQDNGGPTMTHALLNGSPAINAGDDCVLTDNGCGDGHPALPVDQRGSARVGRVDIGAFEKRSKAAAFDFDGDGRADPAVFRATQGYWYINGSALGLHGFEWGLPDDVLVPGDYDGDGRADAAIYRAGTWWILHSGGGHRVAGWGLQSDRPVPADYDGDGAADPAIYRDGSWWILKSTGGHEVFQWGLPTDTPVPADYDGDGRADPAVFRGGVFWVLMSSGGHAAVQWGVAEDVPVPADYDGDNRADPAVYRGGTWWVLRSTGGYSAVSWGLGSDVPVPADYDGEGQADAAVYRGGTWWILSTAGGGFYTVSWGLASDAAVPAAFLH